MASCMPLRRLSLLRFRKKLTVMGIMGHTQGVSSASKPPARPIRKIQASEVSAWFATLSSDCNWSVTGAHRSLVTAGLLLAETSSPDTPAAASLSVVPCFSVLLAADAPLALLPLNLKSTLVGGRQFWSLQAP